MRPFKELSDRIDELSRRFLDPQIPNETDPAFQPDVDGIAAFRVLAHAAIEEWLEKSAREEIAKLSAKSPVRAAHRLLLLAQVLDISIPRMVPFDGPALKKAFEAVLREAGKWIDDNNGIKTGSFCVLTLMCGGPPDEVDFALTSALDAYGKSRGDVAHKGLTAVRTVRAPSAEKADAINLIQAIDKFWATMVRVS